MRIVWKKWEYSTRIERAFGDHYYIRRIPWGSKTRWFRIRYYISRQEKLDKTVESIRVTNRENDRWQKIGSYGERRTGRAAPYTGP